MNIAHALLTPELLAQLLKLPPDWRIIDAMWDWNSRCVALAVESDSIPETKPGDLLPIASANITSVRHQISDDFTHTTEEWRWKTSPRRGPFDYRLASK